LDVKTVRNTAKAYLGILNKIYFLLNVKEHDEGAKTCNCVPQILGIQEALNTGKSVGQW
jgi:hypothetical protein